MKRDTAHFFVKKTQVDFEMGFSSLIKRETHVMTRYLTFQEGVHIPCW